MLTKSQYILTYHICTLTQELPRVQDKLETLAAAWEERNGCPFLVYGQEVMTYLDNLWEGHDRQREVEKAKRVSGVKVDTWGGGREHVGLLVHGFLFSLTQYPSDVIIIIIIIKK